ncbi:MAG: extracellular solute-binding protein [Oceanospirillaceae bacterium]|nr:extracellular solute-binding protein [Oceanospirillaceae bacterium]
MKILNKIMLTVSILGITVPSYAASDMDYLKGLSGEMVSYCSNEPGPCAALIKAFNAAVAEANGNNDFKAKFIRLSTSEMISRVKGELEKSAAAAKRKCKNITDAAELEVCKEKVYKSKVDIAFHGTDDPYRAALGDDFFSPFDYPTGADVQPWAAGITKDSDGRLGGAYLGVLGFGYNTELLAKKGLSVPACWKDLTKPEYKGQIVMANWNTSGTAYKFASTMMQAFPGGEKEGWDTVRAIHKNIAQYSKSGSKGGKMAARGETTIGIGFAHDIISLKQKGFPIQLVLPCEGTLFEIGPIGILRGAKNRKAAEAFALFLYEPSTQNILAQEGILSFPSNVNTVPPEGLDVLKGVKLLPVNSYYSEKKVKGDIISKWTNEVFPLPR